MNTTENDHNTNTTSSSKPSGPAEWLKTSPVEIGEHFFKWRDYTPVPLILLMLFVARPNAISATLGVLTVVFGELIRIYAVSFIGGVSRTRTRSTNQRLITEGAFSIVRNPLYVGNFFITIGVAIYSGVFPMVLLAAIAFGGQYYYIVKYEESLLTTKFGAEYEEYQKQVPAWIPAKMPALDKLPWPETFWPAIESEKRTFLAILAVIVLLMFRAS